MTKYFFVPSYILPTPTQLSSPTNMENRIRLPSIKELTSIPSPRLESFDSLVKYHSPTMPPYFDNQPIRYYTYHPPAYYPYYYQATVASSAVRPPQPSQQHTPPHQPQQYATPEVINKPTNKCHRCGTTETPEWRRGPNGVRTLCNACGLFHAKLVRRKGAALAAEEVLNNKVCKGKNGRRISIKTHVTETQKDAMLKEAAAAAAVAAATSSAGSSPSSQAYRPPNTLPPFPLTPTHMPLPPPIINTNYQAMPLLRH